ncbi:MAG: metallophosphoesterase family protein, partial [Bacilli bacterium]|nr:metallophosphoesterase family protein [Bacilli bacterium]
LIDIGEVRIFITHGHLYLKNRLLQLAKQTKSKIVITGHTHIPFIVQEENIYFCNPGSPNYPRGKEGPSYARILIDDQNQIDIQIILLEDKNERK